MKSSDGNFRYYCGGILKCCRIAISFGPIQQKYSDGIKRAGKRYDEVLLYMEYWHKNYPGKNVEEFIEYVFEPSHESNAPIPRKMVSEFVAAALACPL